MPAKLDQKKVRTAIDDYINSNLSVIACAKKHKMGATTLTRYLHIEKIDTSNYDTRKYSYNKYFFKEIDTEEKAYWIGFIAADGNIHNKTLEIALSYKDKDHLYKFLKNIDGEEELLKYKTVKIGNKEHSVARVMIGSTQITNDLKKYGIVERKGLDLRFPKFKGEILRHYLRGYFDGDGSISTNGKNRNGTPKYALNLVATRSFLQDFMNHMMKLGITKVALQDRGSINSWNKVGINQISIILNYLYGNATIYLDRKYQLARNICRPISTLQKK